MRLDARDLDILRVLSSEGRITKAALAERVGLSPTPCWERLKKLEKVGVLESYRANINLRTLGPHVTIFVAAELNDHTAASFQTFEVAMQRYDEVTACVSFPPILQSIELLAPQFQPFSGLLLVSWQR